MYCNCFHRIFHFVGLSNQMFLSKIQIVEHFDLFHVEKKLILEQLNNGTQKQNQVSL